MSCQSHTETYAPPAHMYSGVSRCKIMDTYIHAWQSTLSDKSVLDAPFNHLPNWGRARQYVDNTLPNWLPDITAQEYQDILERIKALLQNWLRQFEGHSCYYGYIHAFWLPCPQSKRFADLSSQSAERSSGYGPHGT